MKLFTYVLSAMLFFLPTRDAARRAEYTRIATAIVRATQEPDEAIELVSLAAHESGFTVHIRNRRSGATGPWQLLSGKIHRDLDGQAREALKRWRYGMCFYTGETRTAPYCPLASARYGKARAWSWAHPFQGITP